MGEFKFGGDENIEEDQVVLFDGANGGARRGNNISQGRGNNGGFRPWAGGPWGSGNNYSRGRGGAPNQGNRSSGTSPPKFRRSTSYPGKPQNQPHNIEGEFQVEKKLSVVCAIISVFYLFIYY